MAATRQEKGKMGTGGTGGGEASTAQRKKTTTGCKSSVTAKTTPQVRHRGHAPQGASGQRAHGGADGVGAGVAQRHTTAAAALPAASAGSADQTGRRQRLGANPRAKGKDSL